MQNKQYSQSQSQISQNDGQKQTEALRKKGQ